MKSSRSTSMVEGFFLKPCSSSSSSMSLAEIVANTEELLMEILARVPARTLGRFKCVSKHWLFFISDPQFCHRHVSRNRNSSISAVFGDSSTDFSSITFPPAGSNPFNNFGLRSSVFSEEIHTHRELIPPNGAITFEEYTEKLLNKYYRLKT